MDKLNSYSFQAQSLRTFLILWTLAFYMHHAESWSDIPSTIFSLAMTLFCFFSTRLHGSPYLDRATWFLSFGLIFVHCFIQFPILANHLIFVMWVSLALMVLGLFTAQPAPERFARPLLISLGVVYVWAGIHKMNYDFFLPSVSCSFNFIGRWMELIPILDSDISSSLVVPLGVMVIGFESILPLTFLSKRYWLLGMLSALALHMFLAPVGFVDFSSVALAIFVLVVLSLSSLSDERKQQLVRIIPYYFWYQIAAGLLMLLVKEWAFDRWFYIFQVLGLLIFSFEFVVIVSGGFFKDGLVLKPIQSYRPIYLLSVLLLLVGSFNYVGLSTAGTFSMFSNVKTEGSAWNHLFIPKQLKIFSLQDEIYWIRKFDESIVRGKHELPEVGYGLPRIEFERLLDMWKAKGISPKYIEFLTPDGWIESKDIVSDVRFQDRKYSWWVRKVFYFRKIQPFNYPNACRW
jgi:hypothetical protein